ncbi:MAG: hypothetical protein ACK583_13380 [Cyanobacteriota bacterium]
MHQRRILQGSAAVAFAVISGAGGLAFLQLQRARAAQTAQFEATHRALVPSDPFLSVVYGLAALKPLLAGNQPWEAAQLSQSLQEAVMANMARSAPIATDQGAVLSLIELKNGELISGGDDGTLRRWAPAPIARAACRQIDLASIPTDTGLGPVVEAAQATCRSLGVGQ